MKKIFVWCYEMSGWGGDVAGESMSEDGVAIAGHISSNEAWSYHDMIASGWKDGYYKSVYPDGYEIVWLGSNPESSEEWKAAFALNKARHEARTKSQSVAAHQPAQAQEVRE